MTSARMALAGVFDDMAGAAGGADLADDRQDDVLGGDSRAPARRRRAIRMFLAGLLQQGLGRHHVLDLGGADAEGQRAERAMGRGVAVAADDGRAGQGEAQLRADDVDDALAHVEDREVGHAELVDVLLQRLDLDARSPVR